MRGSAVALLLAFSSVTAAQTGGTHATPATVMALPRGNCPIDINMHQKPYGAYLLANTTSSMHPSYLISFHPHGDRAIQQVMLDASGPSGARLRNAAALDTATADTVETFTLTGSGEATIAMKKLTAVEWFSLVSITYTDGSRWHRNRTDACFVPPNGFVPVK